MANRTPFLHAECPGNALCPEHDPASHLLFHEGKLEEFEKRLREILNQCPACPNAIFPLISCLTARGRDDEADLLVERLLPVASNDSQVSYLCQLKGRILDDCLGPKEAIEWFQRAAELDRNSATLSQLAGTAWRLRRRATAAKLADEALGQGPYDPFVIGRCVRILIQAGRSETANAHLLGLAKRNYAIPQYHTTIAQALMLVGSSRKGLALARRVARSHPESADVACTVSGLLMEDGRWNEAAPLLRRLGKLDPAGHGKYALMNLAMISVRRGEFEKMLLLVIEANRDYDDEDTRSLVKIAVATVTGGLVAEKAALEKAEQEIKGIKEEHENLKTSLAGYDTTEGGTNLEYSLREGEGWHIEFKERMPDQARDLAKEIAALSSQTDGGTVFLGIRDNGDVVGMQEIEELQQRDEWRHRIAQLATKNVRPPNPVTVYFNERDGLRVIKIWVPEGSAPIYYVDDIPYIRNLDESRKATPEEVEEYIARRGKK